MEADVQQKVLEGVKWLSREKRSEGYDNGLGVKKTLYQQIIVPTVTFGVETSDLRETEYKDKKIFKITKFTSRI